MKKNIQSTTKLLVFSSLLAALVFISTAYLPRIPTALGYVHPGDGFVLIAASLLPLPYGILASAIGGALADLLTGYAIWAPATFIIKGLMALCISSMGKRAVSLRNILGIIPAILINAGGYYLYQSIFISGNFLAALPEIPFNLLQTAVGGVIFILIGKLFDRTSLKQMIPATNNKLKDKENQ